MSHQCCQAGGTNIRIIHHREGLYLLRQIAALQEERVQQEEVIGGLRQALDAKEVQRCDLARQVELLSKITVTLDGAKIPALDLPSILHLDSMQTHVAQATIAVERVGALPVVSSEGGGSTRVRAGEAMRAVEAEEVPGPVTLLFSENKLLMRLLSQVEALSRSEKALLTCGF